MTLNKQQQDEFLEAAKPLIKWINNNCHPHCTAIVECGSAALVEGVVRIPTDEFIKD